MFEGISEPTWSKIILISTPPVDDKSIESEIRLNFRQNFEFFVYIRQYAMSFDLIRDNSG